MGFLDGGRKLLCLPSRLGIILLQISFEIQNLKFNFQNSNFGPNFILLKLFQASLPLAWPQDRFL